MDRNKKRNPLDAIFKEDVEDLNVAPSIESAPPPEPRKVGRQKRGKKKRVATSLSMDADVSERIRNAVYALSGPPHRMSFANFAAGPLRRAVEQLEKAHNGGAPFPQRKDEF